MTKSYHDIKELVWNFPREEQISPDWDQIPAPRFVSNEGMNFENPFKTDDDLYAALRDLQNIMNARANEDEFKAIKPCWNHKNYSFPNTSGSYYVGDYKGIWLSPQGQLKFMVQRDYPAQAWNEFLIEHGFNNIPNSKTNFLEITVAAYQAVADLTNPLRFLWKLKYENLVPRPAEVAAYFNEPLILGYPAPKHPSWPSGHAVIGGYGMGRLEALGFLREELIPTAFELGLGRCLAGIHFREDLITGMLLGHQYAINEKKLNIPVLERKEIDDMFTRYFPNLR